MKNKKENTIQYIYYYPHSKVLKCLSSKVTSEPPSYSILVADSVFLVNVQEKYKRVQKFRSVCSVAKKPPLPRLSTTAYSDRNKSCCRV